MAASNIVYVCAQYLIFDSLFMVYNLSEVLPSVVVGSQDQNQVFSFLSTAPLLEQREAIHSKSWEATI